jgi:hypothetical protein
MPEFDATIEYREIPGFPGYMAGTDGSLWSQWGLRTSHAYRGSRERFLCGKWHQLNASSLCGTKGYRYPAVTLHNGIKNRPYAVHMLILLTFVGPRPQGHQARHRDGTRTNNRLDNLSWATSKENHADRIEHGTHGRGELSGTAKLTTADIHMIRELRSQGLLHKEIAEQLHIHRGVKIVWQTVQKILSGTRWKHIS